VERSNNITSFNNTYSLSQ
ncbi:unnamed protein product, partial [Allacma fusca]